MSALLPMPVTALALTLAGYLLALRLHQRLGRPVWLHPVLIAALPIALLIGLGLLDAGDYRQASQPLVLLLGPATVALGLPLRRHWAEIRRLWGPLSLALLVGVVTATASAMLLADWLGLDQRLLATIAPKTATSPIAMEVARILGGEPGLAAGLVILTGIIGAMAGPPLFDGLGISDPRIRGFSLGLAAHGVGTARALEEGAQAGAFASLALGLTGTLVALAIPTVLVYWFV